MRSAFWISLLHITFAIEAENGTVVNAAPVAMWAVGKRLSYVLGYYVGDRKATIRRIRPGAWRRTHDAQHV